MLIIKKLCEMIDDELEGAEGYAKCALHYKDSDPALAEVFYTISTEEMRHLDRLHEQVVHYIRKYRDAHGEPPAAMQAVWDYIHAKQIEEAKEIKAYQEQYRA